MGCDIHLYAERKKNGKWESIEKWTKDEDDGERVANVEFHDRIYSDRDYDLFGILADVRNGVGFAGIHTGDGFTVLAMPKGIPTDCDPRIKAQSDQWNDDGHSHSYLTVAELIAYDWTQVTRHQGWVNAVEYLDWARWKKENHKGPANWCGSVDGAAVKKIKEREMEEQIAALNLTKLPWDKRVKLVTEKMSSTYCLLAWNEPYFESCSGFWQTAMPKLLAMGKPEDVRIVFWFDN